MAKLRNITRWMLAMLAMACILNACHIVPEQSQFMNVGSDGWLYGHSLHFHPQQPLINSDTVAPDSIVTADIAVAVRHSNGYEYSNLWVEVSYQGADTLQIDTFDIRLADKLGRWYGTGIGVGFQTVDTVLRAVPIDTRHPIAIRHIMRTDTLRDIEQIGLILNYQ